MDEIEELKRALGLGAKDYNDNQLRLLSHELDLMAEFLLDLYLFRRPRHDKSQTPGFDSQAPEPLA